MKSIFLLITTLLMSNIAFATPVQIRITDHICGEIDPFIIGDACLVQGTSEKKNYALVIDMDEYYYSSLSEIEINDIITVDDTYLELIEDIDTINEMRDFFDITYIKFYYFELLFPTDSVISIEKAKLESVFNLNCHNSGFYDGSFMYAKINFKSTLKVISNNSYILSAPSFNYVLSMNEDFTDIWASANVSDKNENFVNLGTYNPRVYFGHSKFDDIFSRSIFGEVDFILPKEELNTTESKKSFTAYMIMTAMDDHWGGTVDLDCTIQK